MLRILLLLALSGTLLRAQSDVTGIELEGATALHLSANFSQVEIREADGDALTIEHSVTVEGEQRNDLAELSVEREGKTLTVTETNPTQQQLQQFWKNKENGDNCCNSQIRMIVRVPAGVTVTVETIYGSVDINDLAGLSEVNSTYGGVTVVYTDARLPENLELYSNYGAVDLTVPPGQAATFDLTTQFGELLTDIDLTVDGQESERRNFYEHVVGTVGAGSSDSVRVRVRCEAPYGKVYLRKG